MAAPADNFPPTIIASLCNHFPKWKVIDGSGLAPDGFGRALKALKKGTLLVIRRTTNEALWAVMQLGLMTGGVHTALMMHSARMVVFEQGNIWATGIATEERIVESLGRWCNTDHDAEECAVCMEMLMPDNRGSLCCTCDKADVCLKCQSGIIVQSPDGKYHCPHCRADCPALSEQSKENLKKGMQGLRALSVEK